MYSLTITSILELIVMCPLGLSGEDSSVGDSIKGIGLQLKQLVGGLEQTLVISAAVTNDNLR